MAASYLAALAAWVIGGELGTDWSPTVSILGQTAIGICVPVALIGVVLAVVSLLSERLNWRALVAIPVGLLLAASGATMFFFTVQRLFAY